MNVFSPHECNDSDIKILQISDMHLFAGIDEQLVGVNTEQSFLSVLELAFEHSWPPDFIFLGGLAPETIHLWWSQHTWDV